MKKRILSMLLAIVMLVGLLPTAAFAEAQTGITVYLTLFNKGEFCKTKNNEVMWQIPVAVTDTDKDGKYSLDEALSAAHGAYHADGTAAYVISSGMVSRLWGQDTFATGYYRNDLLTNAVTQEFLDEGDKITAFIYFDTAAYSDRYSFFTQKTKRVKVKEEFTLTLQCTSMWISENQPVVNAPLGVYDMKTGVFSHPSTMKGEEIIAGMFMPKPSTGLDGSAKMRFTEVGTYYVSAEFNSTNYKTYGPDMINPLVPPICVVTVTDDDINAVITAIDFIGTVTETSGDKITAARTAYDALTDPQKALVENYKALTDAEAAYSQLLADKANQQKADDAAALIAAIGTVTETSGDKITAARTAYDALTDPQKALVPNADVLTAAEAAYSQLLADKANQQKADDAAALIAAIGTVTETSSDKITAARTAYDALTDSQKALVENYDTLVKAEKALQNISIAKTQISAAKYLVNAMPAPAYGSEWAVFALARNGAAVPQDYYETYYKNVEKYAAKNLKEDERLSPTKSTDNSRLIVALTAIGRDPTDVAGHNLLKALSDLDYVKMQGLNGAVWALIALDTRNFDIPTAASPSSQTTRTALIRTILDSKLPSGGWTFFGDTADPDMTGMALQALAPYYLKDTEVKDAVDGALAALSEMQQDDGGYASFGYPTAESCAQVVTALSALGIDCTRDERFNKNGTNVYDALMAYAAPDSGFKSAYDNKVNTYTTCQAFYAMAAYNRCAADQPSLYNMSDVPVKKDPAPEPETPEPSVPDPSVPDPSVPDPTVPETTVPETTVPETTVPETTVPETTVPETESKPVTPETGDSTGIMLLLALLSVSSLAMIGILKKKRVF